MEFNYYTDNNFTLSIATNIPQLKAKHTSYYYDHLDGEFPITCSTCIQFPSYILRMQPSYADRRVLSLTYGHISKCILSQTNLFRLAFGIGDGTLKLRKLFWEWITVPSSRPTNTLFAVTDSSHPTPAEIVRATIESIIRRADVAVRNCPICAQHQLTSM